MKPGVNRTPIIVGVLIAPAILAGLALLTYYMMRLPMSSGAPTSGVASTPSDGTMSVPGAIGEVALTETQLAAPRIGIFDAGEELFHEGYRMQNAWAGWINGVFAYVVAGARESDPEYGIIEVTRRYPDAAYMRFVSSPTRSGSLRIVAENNHRLTLRAADGTTLYFDVPAEAFVEDLGQTVATLAPPPTFTATAVSEPKGEPTVGAYPGIVELATNPAPKVP